MSPLDAVAAWLLAVSWQLVPLTAVVIILDLALRRAGPVVRSVLWWMVLAKLIVPPGLASPLSIAHAWSVEGVSAIGNGDVIAAPGEVSSSLMISLVALWAFGAIAAAVIARWGYRRVRAACLEGAELLTGIAPHVDDVIATAGRRLGLSKVPPILVAASGVHGAGLPAVIGFFAPCVVLPRELLERSRGEIEHVLLHELAHVRRKDSLASFICLGAQIVFWFHPAIWFARRRLTTLREMSCDRTVARVLGNDATSAYRRTLIVLARSAALAASAAAPASGPGALGLYRRQSQLVTRLDALSRPVSMRRATEYSASAAIAAAILVSCVPLAPASAPASTPSTRNVSIDVPPLDQLPGSLQKRYAVMRAIALSEQEQSRVR